MERREVESVSSEVENRYIANFYLMEAYQRFAKYWWSYAYTEIAQWTEVNSQTFNTSALR